jgi:ABC-type branched-subunit amino acid transport system substrate-binding protein
VVVGIEYIDAARTNAFYARYGGVVHGEDGGVQAQAVADYINATGGIGGRPLQLRRFRVDAFDGTPFDVHDQQMCSFFGEGPRPVAVVAALGWRLLHPCLAERGIPLITNWPTTADTASFARFADYLFAPGSLALDRFAAPYVRGLQAAGFFGRGARVGVVHYARPEFDRAMGALRSELGRAGVRIVADADLPDIPSTAQAARVFTAAETAILRFRAAGVNRVVSVDYGGTAVAIFMQTAEPQGYRPAYGLSTLNSPTFLRAGMPPRQLRGAVGIGWAPLVDVPAQEEGGVPAIRSQCAEIYRRASVATGDRSAYGQFSAFSLCDSLLLLRRALAGASSDSPATVRARIEALGSSYTSGLAMATRLDGAHHDGVSGYRVLRYDEGCSCFRYDGPVRSLDGP